MLVTAGGNQAFMNAVLAITDPDDEIVLLVPYYFNHEMAIVMAGARAVAAETTSDYQIDLDAIRRAITPRTRAVVTVSPNNPTGAVYPAPALQAVNELCRDRGIFHIHDEAYEYFTYGGVEALLAREPARRGGAHDLALLAVQGLRHGQLARSATWWCPDVLFEAVNKIQDTILICPPAVSQHAAMAALAGRPRLRARLCQRPGCDAARDPRGAERRDVPCDVPTPEGAFYYLVRVHSSLDAMTVSERLIREHRVATIPGSAFADPAPVLSADFLRCARLGFGD